MTTNHACLLSLLLLAVLTLCLGGAAVAAEQKIVLKEYLGQTWERQLLTYPFAAAQGTCEVSSLRLTGPNGPQPVQLSEVELWPDGKTVKAAKVSFFADLTPRSENTYTLSYGPTPATKPLVEAISAKPGKDALDITTDRFSARLLLGEKVYDPPAPPAEVPGPILSLGLGDGTQFSGSRLYGKTPVVSYKAKLINSGGVFARAEYLYTYADGNTLRLVAQVNAGDSGIMWDTYVKQDKPDDGVDFLLSQGLPTLVFPVHMEWFTKRKVFLDKKSPVGALEELSLDTYNEPIVTKLTPWNDWWDDYTQTMIPLKVTGKDTELQITARDCAAWVEPAVAGTMRDWGAWQHKLIPVNRDEKGEVYLRVNNAQGIRRFTVSQGAPMIGHQLNVVKDYALDWPEKPKSHPRLFISPEQEQEYFRTAPHDEKQVQWLLSTKPEIRPGEPCYKDAWALEGWLRSGGKADVATQMQLAERLRQHLNLLGAFDTMRSTGVVAALYDALIDSEVVPPEQRPLYRAQIAYLAYKINDPSTWSIERGYRSYNPNMSVSHMLARGILACLLPDHPMAKKWVAPAIAKMKEWMQEVGPEGEWGEGGHYDQVTYSTMIWFALAAQRAGFYDFSKDEAFLKFGMYIAKQQTPLDPQRGNRRVSPPLGRAQGGEMWSHLGLLAALTRQTEPQYSRILQWCWAQSGYDMKVMDARLAGFEVVVLDPNQPMEKPAWASDWFPAVGAILRNGVGIPEENYVNLLTNSKVEFARVSEPGALLKWFAKGRPIAGLFCPGYSERQELLNSRVLRARTWKPGDNWFLPFGNATTTGENLHAFLPRADYVNTAYAIGGPYDANWWTSGVPKDLPEWPPVAKEGQAPFNWRRQLLYQKDDDPGGPNYLIFRDTITGNQPTMWQMWTLSEKLGTPEELAAAPPAPLAEDKTYDANRPGDKPAPARALAGDRFTAVGELDLDLEYYLASPAGTPRWTLRWGTPYQDYGVVGKEFQDLLQIQMPGDGAYFVAMYPRLRTEAAPAFATLGEGKVIQVIGDWGVDYGFLSATEATAEAEGARFRGTAASVQDRQTGIVLALNATGEVAYKGLAVQADAPVSLRVREAAGAVNAPEGHAAMTVTLTLAGDWKPAKPAAGVKWERLEAGKYRLALPAGVISVVLVKG